MKKLFSLLLLTCSLYLFADVKWADKSVITRQQAKGSNILSMFYCDTLEEALAIIGTNKRNLNNDGIATETYDPYFKVRARCFKKDYGARWMIEEEIAPGVYQWWSYH